MKGEIALSNPEKSLAAAVTDKGDYIVFEVFGSQEVDIGDSVDGDLASPGLKSISNRSKNNTFQALIKKTLPSLETAMASIY